MGTQNAHVTVLAAARHALLKRAGWDLEQHGKEIRPIDIGIGRPWRQGIAVRTGDPIKGKFCIVPKTYIIKGLPGCRYLVQKERHEAAPSRQPQPSPADTNKSIVVKSSGFTASRRRSPDSLANHYIGISAVQACESLRWSRCWTTDFLMYRLARALR